MIVSFSARLDEAGTDGRSPYTVVGGAVATDYQWVRLEQAWEKRLAISKVSAFHMRDFDARDGDFVGWSDYKRKRFLEMLEKICKQKTFFRISVGVESTIHADIKRRMKGVRGFHPDSDYGLCLRYLMFMACQEIAKTNTFDDFTLSILVEDGPWAAGAANVYGRVSRMTGKWKPAKHAHRLNGFAVAKKGRTRTLEAADYLTGIAHQRLTEGWFKKSENPQVSILLNAPMLERWYEGMIKEKEARTVYGKRKL